MKQKVFRRQKQCKVCGKNLAANNESLLCHYHYFLEWSRNYRAKCKSKHICFVCGKKVKLINGKYLNTCYDCNLKRNKYRREYNQRPGIKQKIKEYQQRPEIKKRKKDWEKEYNKEYRQRPEVKARIKKYRKEYYLKNKENAKRKREKEHQEMEAKGKEETSI